ncbi:MULTISPECIES: hypothetical protein [unclassified Vreelandella]
MNKTVTSQRRQLNLIAYSELAGCAALEIFNIGVIFYIIESYGSNGSLLVLFILASAFVSGLFKFNFTKSRLFEPYKFSAKLNITRFVLSAIAVIIFYYNIQQTFLVLIAMSLSAIRPHLDGAIFSGLSDIEMPEQELKIATAKVDNASRVARILSPAVVGLLAYLLPYKNIAALSSCLFLVAAMGQYWTYRQINSKPKIENQDREDTLISHDQVQRRDKTNNSVFLKYAFLSQGINAGCWYASMVIGMALIFSSTSDEFGVSHYAIVGFCYGVGNVVSNMFCRKLKMSRPGSFLILGRVLTAFGFFLLLIAPSSLLFYSAVSFLLAIGTPLSDLAFLRQLQKVHTSSEINSSYRKKITSEYAGMLVVSLITIFAMMNFSSASIFFVAFLAMCFVSTLGLIFKKKISS